MTRKTLTSKILEFINEFPGASIKEIAEYLEISPALARSLIYKLRNNGYIEKAGKGYVLSRKGEWFVQNILKKEKTREESEDEVKGIPSQEETIETIEEKTTAPETNTLKEEHRERAPYSKEIQTLINKINLLEERIKNLETKLQGLLNEIEGLKKQISFTKVEKEPNTKTHKQIKENVVQPAPRPKKQDKLPEPIMSIQEAQRVLGSIIDSLIRCGKVEIVGSLVVDSEFYESFKKRFPLSIRDAEKLPPMEKRLLEEMNREAIVIIHAGKYYKLIK
ncbi:MAG: winged helix-turn-helix transcriptional regulator [Staphylothermus sp.]|nr:winged helix-turn-helix transcriptional regulator [Staphylothermus sp.]